MKAILVKIIRLFILGSRKKEILEWDGVAWMGGVGGGSVWLYGSKKKT